MKLDVSDLFDHLFDVANFASARFDLSVPYTFSSPWDCFCRRLSDILFLPACANRAYAVVHSNLTPVQIKARIFSEFTTRYGEKTIYHRYHAPYFAGASEFLATQIDDNSPVPFSRPDYSLTLWLGKLPPSERLETPPPYPLDLESPITFHAQQVIGTFGEPKTSYFQLHGDWCLRQIVQENGRFVRSNLGGRWIHRRGLTEIRERVFDTVWDEAEDEI